MNKYLQKKLTESSQNDYRNPYGSKGGYVDSNDNRRGRRGRDMADYRNDYAEYDSGYDSRNDYESMDSHNYGMGQQYGQYPRYMPNSSNIMKPFDYNEGYSDGYSDARRDYSSGNLKEKEKEYMHKLKEWSHKLKQKALFNMPEEEVIKQAKQMGVSFNDYDEEVFYYTYLMLMSDLKADFLSSPQAYMILAKQWLEDKDSEYKGTDKLLAYYCEVVKGGKKD